MKMNLSNRNKGARRTGLTLSWGMAVSLALFALAGCGRRQQAQQRGMPGGGGSMPPPEVGIVTVKPQSVPFTSELPGRLAAVRVAQVRARVTGIVLHRKFEQGSNVKAGQVLYQIDPAPFQAAYDSAKASLAQAQASLTQAQLLAKRYKPLVGINAVSKQAYDNAVSAAAQAKASVESAKAAVEIASLNLGYATVTAPIAGRIGPALVTEGALVSQSAATEMAVIHQLDPIYFDFTESSKEVLKLRQELASGRLKRVSTGEAKVTLMLPDGTTYPHPGKLLFSDITVNPSSGMVTLRAEFPNPEHWLLPGMFARGRLEQAVAPKTLLVPQPGVTIGPNGAASVMLVSSSNQVETQPVQIGEAVETNWVVTSGLKPGDRVIVSGLQKVHPGMKVKPVAAQLLQGNAVPPAGGGK